MAKIWMQGKERFMCPVCENERIEPGQKYCQICGEALEWDEDKQVRFVEANKTIGKDINVLTKWIPVEERLPEESLNSVIGWDEYRERCCFVQYYAGSWHLGDESVRIIAWMPLPEPFRRRETVMNKSVTDILEEVCSDICDNYCKYRDTVDEGGKCEAIRTGLRCPLDRLN